MKLFEIVLVLVGLGMCLFGALFTLGGVANAIEPKSQSAAVFLLATLFFGIVPAGMGLGLCFYAWRRGRRRSRESEERIVLQLAGKHGGRLTVAEVAMNSQLSSDQAQRVLSRCNLDGICQMDVSEDGVVEYIFEGL